VTTLLFIVSIVLFSYYIVIILYLVFSITRVHLFFLCHFTDITLFVLHLKFVCAVHLVVVVITDL